MKGGSVTPAAFSCTHLCVPFHSHTQGCRRYSPRQTRQTRFTVSPLSSLTFLHGVLRSRDVLSPLPHLLLTRLSFSADLTFRSRWSSSSRLHVSFSPPHSCSHLIPLIVSLLYLHLSTPDEIDSRRWIGVRMSLGRRGLVPLPPSPFSPLHPPHRTVHPTSIRQHQWTPPPLPPALPSSTPLHHPSPPLRPPRNHTTTSPRGQGPLSLASSVLRGRRGPRCTLLRIQLRRRGSRGQRGRGRVCRPWGLYRSVSGGGEGRGEGGCELTLASSTSERAACCQR